MTYLLSCEGKTEQLQMRVSAAVPPLGDQDKRHWLGFEHCCSSMPIMRQIIGQYVGQQALMIRVQIETQSDHREYDSKYNAYLICEYVYVLTDEGYKVHWIRSGVDTKADLKASNLMLDLINQPCSKETLSLWLKTANIFKSKGWETNIQEPLTFP